ncbi:heavy metal-binding domain-containing protein [Mucilaginibacter polytrichastri]|uniref:Heavy metal binding domain-containing protein n=1 Tax=Mucilaginibacter polytrichastri TaxID=1302689 RepID=A0A1Q5ZUZ3_9SPHI|nr:heavy metal-binding domain-containing protein [Mucilaginibacter polytrichastri]OKS85585.1 hypothetical protein RG47T_1031 [Mucilaginibacter polytrichastri]SFS36134.1 hypothetical protein SAMN04487890_10169 [Mucilaginibacter polytrichastri]
MKKLVIILAVVLAGCAQPAPKKQALTKCKYTCVMDKDVCEEKPGVCPKCGMKLVEKEEDK